MDLEKLTKNLKARGFDCFYAATAEEASAHVLEQVQNPTPVCHNIHLVRCVKALYY